MKAYDNFMRATGFGGTNTVPQAAPNPPFSVGGSTRQFVSHSDSSNPRAVPYVPGQMGPQPGSQRGQLTPNNGLVPGHLPSNLNINPTLRQQQDALTNTNLLGQQPFVVGEPGRVQDWRATNVGPETDKRQPGHVAVSPPNQGYLMPTFTGTIHKEAKPEDGPFPIVANAPSDDPLFKTPVLDATEAKLVQGPGYDMLRKVEKMVGGNYRVAAYIFGAATLASTVAWMHYGSAWVVATLICASITVFMLSKLNKESARGGHRENNKANAYESRHTMRSWDTSNKQEFRPLKEGQPDFNPYPKPLDTQSSTHTRMQAQGLLESNVEGPRSDYWYKRGPTPANRERVKTKDLMRSANMYNMNERDFDEFMARLDGEAPDQFYQAHPYMSVSPFWENRQQINDMDTVHGVSTAPGTFNRKWAYKTPRIQQAGAKTMHLKDPPPGYGDAIGSKVHPWLQPPNNVVSKPFDTDDFIEKMKGDVSSEILKVTSSDAGRISADRQAEDNYYRSLYGVQHKNPDDLPPELQPVPTSREGIIAQQKEREKKWAMDITNEQDRVMNYVQNVQGYGYTVLPPFPNQNKQVPPVDYIQNPPYGVEYQPPNRMPAPNLKDRPQVNMVATAGMDVSNEKKAQNEFEDAFKSTTPDEDTIKKHLANIEKR